MKTSHNNNPCRCSNRNRCDYSDPYSSSSNISSCSRRQKFSLTNRSRRSHKVNPRNCLRRSPNFSLRLKYKYNLGLNHSRLQRLQMSPECRLTGKLNHKLEHTHHRRRT